MSWSVQAVGKPLPVAVKLAKEMGAVKSFEPEQDVKDAVAVVLTKALEAQHPDSVVNVEAAGHQGILYGPDNKAYGIYNSVSIKITPMFGFVE